MQKITSESEIEDVMKQIGVGEGEELRESTKRKNLLEKLAQLRSRNPDVELSIEDTHTAFVEVEEEMEEFKNITIPSRKWDQEVTDLPEDYFDYLIQRAMTCHEVGHILYSSWPALEKYINKVEEEEDIDTEQYKLMFKHFVNVLEDGAIEEYLRNNYRVEEEILALRATIHETHYMGNEFSVDEDKEYHYPFFYAVMAAGINIGIYDNKEIYNLLDENNDKHFFAKQGGEYDREMLIKYVLPRMEEDIPKIQAETDSEKRMKLCYELWDFVRDYIDRSPTSGKSMYKRRTEDAMEGDSYLPGVPSNLSESHGDQEQKPLIVSIPGNEDNEGDAGAPQGPSAGEIQGNKARDLEADSEGGDEKLREKAQSGIQDESKQASGGDWSDELEEIINALGAGDGTDEIIIPDGEDVPSHQKNEAKRHGKRTEKVFRRKLKWLQRDRVQRDRRRGHLDRHKMVEADRGSTKIFQKTKEGDKKDYSCMMVVDRSGSMRTRIDDVELAVGSLAYGLEANGIDTSILDTHQSKTTLAKPFGADVKSFEDKIFGNRYGGGTPLRHTINFARRRMKAGRGKVPFMIVITDGRPKYPEKVKEEIRKANFPVIGLYLTNGRKDLSDQLSLYDRAVEVEPDQDIGQRIINLIKGIVF